MTQVIIQLVRVRCSSALASIPCNSRLTKAFNFLKQWHNTIKSCTEAAREACAHTWVDGYLGIWKYDGGETGGEEGMPKKAVVRISEALHSVFVCECWMWSKDNNPGTHHLTLSFVNSRVSVRSSDFLPAIPKMQIRLQQDSAHLDWIPLQNYLQSASLHRILCGICSFHIFIPPLKRLKSFAKQRSWWK